MYDSTAHQFDLNQEQRACFQHILNVARSGSYGYFEDTFSENEPNEGNKSEENCRTDVRVVWR